MCVTSITLFMQTSAKNAYVTSTIAKSTELPYFWRRGLSRHSLFLSTFLRSVRTKNTIFQNYYKFKAIRRPTGVCHAAKVVPCSFNLFTTFVFLINPVH